MPVTTNLVSDYALDETSGNATDSVSAVTLTDHASVGSNTGKIGSKCRTFNGTTQYLSQSGNPGYGATSGAPFTYVFWFNATTVAPTDQQFLGFFDGTHLF